MVILVFLCYKCILNERLLSPGTLYQFKIYKFTGKLWHFVILNIFISSFPIFQFAN